MSYKRPYPYQVFLCHSSKDKDVIVLPFCDILKLLEVEYWVDSEQIEWGSLISESISYGLKQSQYVVVFLSKNFLESNYACAELSSSLSYQIKKGEKRILPVIIDSEDGCLDRFFLLRDIRYLKLKQSNLPLLFEELSEELQKMLNIDSNKKGKWSTIPPVDFFKKQLGKVSIIKLKRDLKESLSEDDESSLLALVYSIALLRKMNLATIAADPVKVKEVEVLLPQILKDKITRSTGLFLQAFILYDFYKRRNRGTKQDYKEVLLTLMKEKRAPDYDLIVHLKLSRNFESITKEILKWAK
jgi:hypothetical protein